MDWQQVGQQVRAKAAAVWAKSKAVGMSMMVAASLTLPAFATVTDGGSGSGSGSSGGMASIISAADTVVTFVSKGFDLMTSNPLTAVYLASGLLSVGLGKFIMMRRAAH